MNILVLTDCSTSRFIENLRNNKAINLYTSYQFEDIEKSIEKLDKDLVKKYKAKLVDKKEIEISISRKQNITDLISDLSKMDIIVTSFRNKRSRLEQLFINITKE